MEFDDAMARVAERLRGLGEGTLATAALSASAEMAATYSGGRGAQSTRRQVRLVLDGIASDLRAAAVLDDLQYAIGWIEKAEELDGLVSAKHHIDRRPSRTFTNAD